MDTGGGSAPVTSVNGQIGDVVLDASDIGVTPAGNISATDVQGALVDLDSAVTTLTTDKANLSDLIAANIAVTPSGGISSTDAQAALEELDAEKADVSSVPTSTDDLPEGPTNKYFSEAAVLATLLTGFSASPGTVSPSDTLLQALEKIVGNAVGGSFSIHTGTFSGTSITPTTDIEQIYTYVGSSSQDFTGFGPLSGVADGTTFILVGSDDTYPIVVSTNDASDGWLMPGLDSYDLVRGKTLTFRKIAFFDRLILTGRT